MLTTSITQEINAGHKYNKGTTAAKFIQKTIKLLNLETENLKNLFP